MNRRTWIATTALAALVGGALVAAGSTAGATTGADTEAASAVPASIDAVNAAMDAAADKAAANLAAEQAGVAAAGRKRLAYFVFHKARNPIKSTLGWYEYRVIPDRPPVLTYKARYRAGSGDGTKDSCRTAHGWLPNGWYGGTFRTGFDGIINGIVWQLDNKKCKRNGTMRTELFIHSEMTPGAGQNCGYEPECWNGSRDYYSAGCIKIRPSHTKKLAKRYRGFYGDRAKRYKNRLLLVTS